MSEYYKTRQTKPKVVEDKESLGKRRCKRFHLNDTSIKLRKAGLLKFFWNTDQVSLVNLSKSGVQLLITETLKADEDYQIDLYAPGFINPLMMRAKVVWCKPYKKFFDKTYYRAGLQFVKLRQEVADSLKNLEMAVLSCV